MLEIKKTQNLDTSIFFQYLCLFFVATCPNDWTTIGDTCFSPPRKTHEWKGTGNCDSNCDAVEKLCTDVGATLATKEETHAWLDNGGDRLGMMFGLTSNMNGNMHWFTQELGDDYGWNPGCCDHQNRFFVCAKAAGPGQ